MPDPIRLLIVDDSPLTRAGAVALLSSQADIVVVGQAENGQEALRLFKELRPHVVLTDLRMPGMDGVDLTRLLCAEDPAARVLVLTHYVGDENVPVTDEETQARVYGELVRAASCDADVAAVNLFGFRDDALRAGFQAGLYRADGSPRPSLVAVRDAIAAAGCAGAAVVWQPSSAVLEATRPRVRP